MNIAEKFVSMVYNYAKELQGNTDKYVMKFVSEIVKLAVEKGLITLEDLYIKKEEDICKIFHQNFSSWKRFNNADLLVKTEEKPNNVFCISLVKNFNEVKRVNDCSDKAANVYKEFEKYTDSKYAYVEIIKKLD